MTFEQVFETLPANGWLTKVEAKMLWDNMYGTMLEVGSYYGRSTVLLGHMGTVIAVDPFNDFDSDDPTGDFVYGRFVENTEGLPVVVYRQKIEDFPAQSVDSAFLDGDHTYKGTKAQIKKAQECGAKTILIHDYEDSGEGMEIVRAARELLGEPDEHQERMALWKQHD